MKKFFLIFATLLMVTFFGCQKEPETSQTQNMNNVNKEPIIYVGGDIIYGDNWTGWIDPELVGGDKIYETTIALGEANKKGEMVVEGNCTSIICNEAGNNCGQILNMTEFGPIPIGLYLLN